MREDANWFAKWEEELPSPEELMPLSQTLITPDLAAAFDITAPNQTPPLQLPPLPQPEFDSTDLSADEPARTLKRPRLVWTPQLHKRFVDAVAHLGIKNAVPKTIMQLMNVDGLTRENVASHLQKYRLYLKRMQGLSSDSACDHLFATTTVPHFLHRQPEDHHLLPFVPVAPALHPHHHHAIAAAAAHNHQQQQQHFGGGGVAFGSPPAVQFDHRFLARHHQPLHRIIPPGAPFVSVEDLGSTSPPTPVSPPGSGRKVLTLFPTAED